jgi:hypothetical protein
MTAPRIYSDHFYAWEQQYRGHTIIDQPVSIQPAFNYFKRFDYAAGITKDDSLAPTHFEALSSVVTRIYQQLIKPVSTIPPANHFVEQPQFARPQIIFGLYIPTDVTIKHQDFAAFLEMASIQAGTIAFEIIATAKKIQLQFAVAANRADIFASLSSSFLPQLIVQRIHNDLLSAFAETNNIEIVEFAPRHEFIRPLRFIEHSQIDPFIVIFSALENLQNDEQVALQILFHISDKPWKEVIMSSLHNQLGQPFFYQASEMIPAAEQKCLHPQFGVIIRAAFYAQEHSRMHEIKQDISNAIINGTSSATNQLMSLNNNSCDIKISITDIINRTTHRKPFVSNSHELLSLVHAPGVAVLSRKYRNAFARTKQVPEIFLNHPFVLGNNVHAGLQTKVTMGSELMRHGIVVGGSGMGKSNLLISMAKENMRLGNGVCVIDPHGSLVDTLLYKFIPEQRRNDVILLDPTDHEFPFALNLLKAFSEREKEVLSSDIVSAFRKNSSSWGDGLNSIFANAISTFLYSSRGGTLADVRRFLLDRQFREEVLETVSDQQLIYYWQHEFPLLRTSSVGSIMTRLDVFLRPKAIRNMVAQPTGLDFERLMNEKKILLVKLSVGHLGVENAYILGSMIITKIYQAALARQGTNNLNDFFLYADELQHFLSGATSINDILTGARKFHLSLVAATQSLSNISDPAIIDAILTNAATRICFRLGDADAKKFAEGFSSFTAFDLQNLKVGDAICRIDRPEQDFSLTVPLPEETVCDENVITEMIACSREKYCVPRETVERLLLESIGMNAASTEKKHESKYALNILQQPATTETFKTKKQDEDSELTITNSNEKNAKQLQHREMQMLVKEMGEQFGFVATIEQQLPNTTGQVDVLLTKERKTIAVEISVRTGKKWEVHNNIEKCIAAKYDIIISLTQNERQVRQIKNEFEKMKIQTNILIYFFTLETFYAFLQKEENQEAVNKKVRGYQVNVSFEKSTD